MSAQYILHEVVIKISAKKNGRKSLEWVFFNFLYWKQRKNGYRQKVCFPIVAHFIIFVKFAVEANAKSYEKVYVLQTFIICNTVRNRFYKISFPNIINMKNFLPNLNILEWFSLRGIVELVLRVLLEYISANFRHLRILN